MTSIEEIESRDRQLWMWPVLGVFLLALSALLAWVSPRFGYQYTLAQLPAVPLALGLVAAGLAYLTLPGLIALSLRQDPHAQRRLLALILVLGALMRVALLWSEPALEDDYQRYMWDGAVTANGLNPYALAPGDAPEQPLGSPYRTLADQSGLVIGRVNHSRLKTIYPPVTQAFFALAHVISPFSLVAWRVVCLGGEALTLGLLLLLLRESGRSPLWVAIYWWNPVAIKELINSAHMEAILMPLVLAAFWFSVRHRFLAATLALGLAMGAKLWPILLAPLILRNALDRPKLLAGCAALLAAMGALWIAPPYLGGIDQVSGFVVYAQEWKTGSALFPQVETIIKWVVGVAGWPDDAAATWAGLIARGGLGVIAGCVVLWLARRPVANAADLMVRGCLGVAALLLLSPAQFPWYAIWLIPFLCFLPSLGLLAITALIPLYYVAFYFIGIGQREVFGDIVVWVIWVPVWLLIISELWSRPVGGSGRESGADNA